MTDEHAGGTYTLVIEVPSARTIQVGALGEYDFEAGWYAYTGSALGPGGFGRVTRHRELAAGARDVRHWHVDYLLGATGVSLDAVVRSPGAAIECAVAQTITGTPVPDFGSSDCDCASHLTYDPQRRSLLASVREAHQTHASDEILLDE